MQITVYSRNGTEIETMKCVNVHPFGDTGYQMVVTEEHDRAKKMLGAETRSDPHFITSLPVHGDGVDMGWAPPDPTDPNNMDTYKVCLHDNEGGLVKKFTGCKSVRVVKGAIYFWHEDRYHIVAGDVVAQLEEREDGR